MKYLKQFLIVLVVSFLGELLHALIALPIPASIYGLVLMLAGLMTGLVKLPAVRDAAQFLISLMPVIFVPAAVGLMTAWDLVQSHLIAYLVLIAVTTVAVMTVSGLVTQAVVRAQKGREKK